MNCKMSYSSVRGMRLCVAAGLIASLCAVTTQAALTDGLVAYYPLNEGSGLTATDVIGGHHGTLNGHFIATPGWTTGKLGGGLHFKTTARDGGYFAPPYAASWIDADSLVTSGLLNDTGSYTFSAWVKFQWRSGQNWGFIIWGANTVANANGNVMRVGISSTGIGMFAALTWPIGDFDFNDDGWHLVTITMGPDGNADYYIDGVLNVSKADHPTAERERAWSTSTLFHFGMEMEANTATDGFNGVMDELAIWNRELTAQEVSDLYNGGAGVSLWEPPAAGTVISIQ